MWGPPGGSVVKRVGGRQDVGGCLVSQMWYVSRVHNLCSCSRVELVGNVTVLP